MRVGIKVIVAWRRERRGLRPYTAATMNNEGRIDPPSDFTTLAVAVCDVSLIWFLFPTCSSPAAFPRRHGVAVGGRPSAHVAAQLGDAAAAAAAAAVEERCRRRQSPGTSPRARPRHRQVHGVGEHGGVAAVAALVGVQEDVGGEDAVGRPLLLRGYRRNYKDRQLPRSRKSTFMRGKSEYCIF